MKVEALVSYEIRINLFIYIIHIFLDQLCIHIVQYCSRKPTICSTVPPTQLLKIYETKLSSHLDLDTATTNVPRLVLFIS